MGHNMALKLSTFEDLFCATQTEVLVSVDLKLDNAMVKKLYTYGEEHHTKSMKLGTARYYGERKRAFGLGVPNLDRVARLFLHGSHFKVRTTSYIQTLSKPYES